MPPTEVKELNQNTLMEDEKSRPALYNPSKISLFGFFFTPIAGAWLQHRNWLILKEPDRANESKDWLKLMVVIYAIVTLMKLTGLWPSWNWVTESINTADLTFLFVTWIFWFGTNSNLTDYIDRKQITFKKRSWVEPCFASAIVILAYNFALSLIASTLN